jgi:hypothetical protein
MKAPSFNRMIKTRCFLNEINANVKYNDKIKTYALLLN